MHLDMQTMAAVNVTVTAILGGVLLFTWARERDSAFVGWWGLAPVIMSAGVILSSFPVGPHADLLHLGLDSPTRLNGRRRVLSRHADVDTNIIQLALVMVPVRRFHHDGAADDSVVEALELRCLLADALIDGGGGFHVADADLQRLWHCASLLRYVV